MLATLVVGSAFLYLFAGDVRVALFLAVGLASTLWVCQYVIGRAAGSIASLLRKNVPQSRNAGIHEPGYRLGQKKNLPDSQPARPVLSGEATRRRVDDAYKRLVALMQDLDRQYALQRSSVSLEGPGRLVIRTPGRQVLSAAATPVGVYHVATSTWRWAGPFETDAQDRRARLLPADVREPSDAGDIIGRDAVRCAEGDGWEFTALAASACSSDGAFRLVSGGSRQFVLFAGLRQVGTD